MGILQQDFEIADPRVTFSTIEGLNRVGYEIHKPEYLCYIPTNIPVTLLLISVAGQKLLKVADATCIECAHFKKECPISAFSLAGKRQLLPGWKSIVNSDKPTGERETIPNFIALLANTLSTTLLLPALESSVIDYSEPVYSVNQIADDVKLEI